MTSHASVSFEAPAVPEIKRVSLSDVAKLLDERTALVITLVSEGLPVDFIAATLGITEKKARKILERGHARLAKAMKHVIEKILVALDVTLAQSGVR